MIDDRILTPGRMAMGTAIIATLAGAMTFAQEALPAAANPPIGASGEVIAESTLHGAFDLHGAEVSDLHVTRVLISPGGSNGWHSHESTVFVSVTQGVASAYYADEPLCPAHRTEPGMGMVERPNRVHIVRNEGRSTLVLYVLALIPHGQTVGISRPRPANCPY